MYFYLVCVELMIFFESKGLKKVLLKSNKFIITTQKL